MERETVRIVQSDILNTITETKISLEDKKELYKIVLVALDSIRIEGNKILKKKVSDRNE